MEHLPAGSGRRFELLVGLALAGMLGCVPVKPEGDYRRAAELVTQHTGTADVYDPQAADGVVQDKIERLLEGGLTVEEAVAVALVNNREFQAAFATIGVSRAELVQSGLLSNPELSFMARFPEGGGRSDLELTFAQQLVDLWQIPVRKKIAAAQLEATILDVARQAVDLAAEVRGAAYELIMLRQAEATIRENLQLVQQSEELARARFEAGMASQLDVNLARLDTINMRLELLQLERERDIARSSLARLLNFSSPARSFELSGNLPDSIRPPGVDALLDLAAEQRVDARAAEQRFRVAETQVRQEWLKIFPSLTAGFNFERMERRAMPGRKILADTARESIAAGQLMAPPIESRAQRQLAKRLEIDTLLGPEFTVTLPIWDQNQAQIAKARFEAQQRLKDYENLLNNIANQVEQATITLNNAGEIVQFYREQALPQATLALENARQLYQAGEQGIVVMIEAQESLVTRRQAYIRALGAYARARAELERAVGGRLPQDTTATQPAASRAAG